MRLYPLWIAIICCMTLAFVLGVSTGAELLLYVLAFALLALLVALFFIEVLR